MTSRAPVRTSAHVVRSSTLVGLAVVCVVVLGVLAYLSLSSASGSPFDVFDLGRDGDVDEADGVVPDGVTVFDDEFPAVANLDPALFEALRRAADDAAADGVEIDVNSGWRSVEYQEQLLRDAIDDHGSREEAARWVATPETSPHVSGDAVDLGPASATAWLADHGEAYGLCQIYDNEPWHYELRPEALDQGWCPARYPDATYDPRLRS